jgi:hypothetical protein
MISISVRLVLFSLLVALLVRGGVAASRYVGQAVRVQAPSHGSAPAGAPAFVRPTIRLRTT